MDSTARLWDVECGQEICTFAGHEGELVALNFNTDGDLLLTGSFDNTARVWDTRTGECARLLDGHKAEISST